MTDIFQFYASSADAAPGKGAGETLVSPASAYAELRKIKNWRRILSNFASTPFEWDGHRWNTVEHAFQAAKFKNDADKSLYLSFTLDSGSELGKADGAEAQKKRKARILSPTERTEWDSRSQEIMEELWRAKFTQSEEARNVLLLTGNAQLWHSAPRVAKVRWEGLERIREEIRGEERKGEESEELKGSVSSEEKMDASAAPAPAPKKGKKAAPAAEAVKTPAPAAPKKGKVTPKSKKNPAATTSRPESVLAASAAASAGAENLTEVPVPDRDAPEEPSSTLKFCPICRNYLYMQVEFSPDGDHKKSTHFRLCRCCGYKDEDEKGGLLSEILIQERSAEGYKILLNEHTRKDPRLPHIRGVMKCPEPSCRSNHGVESDIIYMKYDSVNLLYLYICDVCGFQWRSRR